MAQIKPIRRYSNWEAASRGFLGACNFRSRTEPAKSAQVPLTLSSTSSSVSNNLWMRGSNGKQESSKNCQEAEALPTRWPLGQEPDPN